MEQWKPKQWKKIPDWNSLYLKEATQTENTESSGTQTRQKRYYMILIQMSQKIFPCTEATIIIVKNPEKVMKAVPDRLRLVSG